MADVRPYPDLPVNTTPALTDSLLGTDDPAGTPATVNFPISDVLDLAADQIAAAIAAAFGDIASLFPSVISGLGLANNGSDPTNDVDIAAGTAVSDDGTTALILASALTKRLDAAWAVGTNQGGLDTGSIANDWYHIWLIERTDTGVVDALFSASATAPSMPANYDKKRRIGAVLRTGGALKTFTQWGDEFWWLTPVLDVSDNTLTTAKKNYTLGSVPDGLVVLAIANIAMSCASAAYVYVSNPNLADLAPSQTVAPLMTLFNPSTGGSPKGWPARLLTDNAAQISARSTVASTDFRVATQGWVDPRGKF